MASMTTPRLPFLPARTRSAVAASSSSSSSSPSSRRSIRCSSSTNANSAPIPSTPRRPPAPVADGVGSADLNGLRAPPVTVADSPLPAYRDPHGLPRPLTSADLMESSGEGLKVAYQGFPGAYSEAAAKKAYPNCQTVPCEHFDTAFQAVQNWIVDRAVLPLENTLGGSIHRNYDLLLRHELHIVGEVRLAVRHCLLANRGVKIENLRNVISHPQALAQCEHTLTELGIEHRQAVDDTAGAAKLVAEQMLQDTGAVASSLAAELYGLDILAENIQDEKVNVTRFMMLAREPIIPRVDKPFKTSIVFSLEEGPGQLFKALAVFALREINLTKIESRPHKKRPFRVADDTFSTRVKYFDYLFYVDLEASMADPQIQNALRNLEEFATFSRVLGSYPTDGFHRYKVVHGGQAWRLETSTWLHAGLIHLGANMISLIFVGVRLEQQFGFWKVGLVYLFSGLGGSVLSVLFIRSGVSVGASGALFGLLGAMLSELITNWTIYTNRLAAMANLIIIAAINLALGILPHVDNFAHIGGFLTGFLLGFVLLIQPRFGWMEQPFGGKTKSKYTACQIVLLVVALLLAIAGLAVGLLMVFRGVNGNDHCSWCHYITCVPTSHWKCDN